MKQIAPIAKNTVIVEAERGAVAVVREFFRLTGGVAWEKPLEYLQLDPGGSITFGEPEALLKVGGSHFNVRLRHMPHVRMQLAFQGELPELPGYKGLNRSAFMTVFSNATADALAAELDRQMRARAGEVEEWERKLSISRAQLGESGGWLTLPYCGFCRSGKSYAECCGKPTKQN